MPTIRALVAIFVFFAALMPLEAAARTLTIGTTQFPSTLNPNIDSMLAKSYLLGLTMRPLTQHDHEWEPRCVLCVTLPTIENGLAEEEATIEGGRGMAIT